MRNHEINQPIELLDENGNLNEPGFARTPLFSYNRDSIRAKRLRIKEWDYYLVMTDDWAAAFTLSDLGYIRMASASFLDLATGLDCTKTVLAPARKDFLMPADPENGKVTFKNKEVEIRFESTWGLKHVMVLWQDFCHHAPLKADIWFVDLPEESMNIATPFKKDGQFYLNHKMNCMPAEGTVSFDWKLHRLKARRDSGIFDWGRGVWPYDSTWYWGTCSSQIDGKPFGFSLGYGFGSTEAASENVLFYNGKVHKLDDVAFHIPADPMSPWRISCDDGRLEAFFVPSLDRAAKITIGPILTDQHQYFGKITGTAVLDSGKKLKFDDLPCAFEKVHNRY